MTNTAALRFAAAALALALLAGCGAAASKAAALTTVPAAAVQTQAPTTVAPIDYGKQYLAIVAPANTALDKMRTATQALPNTATVADYAVAVAPYVAAGQTADDALLRAVWPASVLPDVKLMVAADGVVLGNMRSLASQNALSVGAWITQSSADEGRAGAAANVVRSDLGLPPPPA